MEDLRDTLTKARPLYARQRRTMTTGIAIMAKAPRAGHSKTRLMPHLSGEEAAAISAAFLGDMSANLALAAQAGRIVSYVAYAPAGAEHLFHGILAPETRLLLADGSAEMPRGVEGFGRCLLHATRSLLQLGHSAACVLNADSPNLPTRLLHAAAEALERSDCVVMGPAEDGGYYLLGMRHAHARLFSDITWSTGSVAAQTRARAAEIGLPLVELDPWYDVDEPATLARLLRDMSNGRTPGAFAAPHAAACAARLGLERRFAIQAGPASHGSVPRRPTQHAAGMSYP